MTISENILAEGSLRATAYGFDVQVLLNWYRALPLSCVELVEIRVDGAAVPRSAIGFVLNGRERKLDDLLNLTDEQWFVQDRAVLRVRRTPPVRPGDALEVSLRLGCRIPYILTGPASALQNVSSLTRRMTAG